MDARPPLVAMDLEGVLVPEVWINVAERTGIPDLRRTTRDEPDYDKLMRYRLGILDRHGLNLADIQAAIGTMEPLPGGRAFVDWVRQQCPFIILSDTFEQFAGPLMAKLGWPTLFCNRLEVEPSGRISGWRLRQRDGKRKAIEGLHGLDYRIIAFGDSYNDTSMLGAADCGVLFRPSAAVVKDFPQFPVIHDHAAMRAAIADFLK